MIKKLKCFETIIYFTTVFNKPIQTLNSLLPSLYSLPDFQMSSFTFVLTGSLFTRNKVCKYACNNVTRWKAFFMDPTLQIQYTLEDRETTFLRVTTENTFVISDLQDTILEKLQEAVVRTHERFGSNYSVDLDIMYRHNDLRTEYGMVAGELVGFCEYPSVLSSMIC